MTTPTLYLRATDLTDRIGERAATLSPKRATLALAMLIPFVLGWLLGTTVKFLWLAVAWLWTAAVIGFQTARGDTTDRDVG